MLELKYPADHADEAEVRGKYELLTKTLIARQQTITTMESCTSGLVASLITDTEGSSAVMKGAFVTYSNEAKIKQGVSADIISTFGVYSPETAAAMARVCRDAYAADFAIGITGTFGNIDPNNEDSIPGEVNFAIARRERMEVFHCRLPLLSSRLQYKLAVADMAADRMLEMFLGVTGQK
ncbi:MAG: CinA family protein [Lachnospiraceae bacterium]|nr:CinA family protein [Lachnospiraceae bacterium]